MPSPGLALIIAKMKKDKGASHEEPEPSDDGDEDMDDGGTEQAAMSSFIEAVHGGDEQAASEALKDYLKICFPKLDSDSSEDKY